MDPVRIVEAVLFSSHDPLRVAEIARETGLSQKSVSRAIKSLGEEYDSRRSAIEIARTGHSYSMKLREEYVPYGRVFADREVPEGALKTAAMIAYHQPIMQSELVRMLGSGVYDHVRTLRSLGLIYARKRGHTLELTTTKRFCEYFGIESTKREDIRNWIEGKIPG